ncbi:hypothetical protein P9112_000660 [Eukaryota sp. TZLM1-RC]
MHIVLLTSILLLLGSVTSALNPNEVESFLDGIVHGYMREHHVSAATVSVVHDKATLLSKGYGMQSPDVPTNHDTSLFRPGSVSKLFAWTAVMQLVEQSKLDLDEDINQYLDFEIPSSMMRASSDNTDPITLRHLLTHTPGFEDQMDELFAFSEPFMTLEQYCKEMLPARLYPPGQTLSYSNYGTALAGYIVELTAGIPFEEYVDQYIFQPLGMSHSTFFQPLPSSLSSHMTQVNKLVSSQWESAPFEVVVGSPAGGLSSSASDMAKFLITHLDDEETILSTASKQTMHSHQFSHHEELNGMALGFMETSVEGRRVLRHGGNTLLFHSGFYLIAELNLGFFISFNGGTGSEHEKVFVEFVKRFYPADDVTGDVAKCDDDVDEYLGEYEGLRSSFSQFTKLLGLFTRINVGKSSNNCLQIQGNEYIHLEDGLFKARYSNISTPLEFIAFSTAPDERMLLTSEMPMDFVKVKLFESLGILALFILFGIVMLIGSPVWWFLRFLSREKSSKDQKEVEVNQSQRDYIAMQDLGSRGNFFGDYALQEVKKEVNIPQFFGFLFVLILGTTLFMFIAILISLVLDVDPILQFPKFAFGEISVSFKILVILPFVFVGTSLVMLVFAIIVVVKSQWKVKSRIHFVISLLSALGVCWFFVYNRFLW